MFAKQEFIDASRKFVCIRIETYENKESEAKVRELLNGRFANTAFCVFDPQGERRLTRSGRSPDHGLGSRRDKGDDSDDLVIENMNRIAAKYQAKGKADETLLQDFLTFRQALNVASADQRLLLFANVEEKSRSKVEATLKRVFVDSEIVGKFHLNFADPKVDGDWGKAIKGANKKPGLIIIRSGEYGIDGTVIEQLPVDADEEKIKSALLVANQKFAIVEGRKDYASHVKQGRRRRIYFENEIPYGEDRGGGGNADRKRGRQR